MIFYIRHGLAELIIQVQFIVVTRGNNDIGDKVEKD